MHSGISLIIPVKDEEVSIGALLDSIGQQTTPPDEIVITDGGSRDRTIAIIESYRARGYPIKLVKEDHAYPGRARNLAISASSHEWVAMTDAGIRLDREWLRELVRPLDEGRDVDVVYGSYEPVADSFFKRCLVIASLRAPRLLKGKAVRSNSIVSCLMKKAVWQSVGGFPDFRAAEDRIFMEKVEEKRFKIEFAPDARVFWDIPSDLRSVFERFSTLSTHDLRAGRFKDWHRSVILMYLAGTAIALAGIFSSPLWLILLLLGVAARGVGLVLERAEGPSPLERLHVKRLIAVTAIMIWIDLAMFWGIVRFLGWKMLGGHRRCVLG
jgi:glycosyltransferase involved in cell wall biosynthesis